MKDSEIIQHLANGMTVNEIAELSGKNKRSIEGRISVLRERHDCKTVTQLVVCYIKKGLAA